jgi:hypothetical protein
MAKKKSWSEKLRDGKDLPKVVALTESARKRWQGNTMVIPSPIEVNEIMASVPKGKLITIQEIRRTIARRHHADIGCPLTCGIFAWIAAHAAEEEALVGKQNTTPYWRTLKSGGALNPKYPGGIEKQKQLLESEGHNVIQKGTKALVEHFEKKLLKTG